MTQAELVLNMLRAGEGITKVKATHYGVSHLLGVIHKLRGAGHDIVTKMRKDRYDRRYAEYRLRAFV